MAAKKTTKKTGIIYANPDKIEEWIKFMNDFHSHEVITQEELDLWIKQGGIPEDRLEYLQENMIRLATIGLAHLILLRRTFKEIFIES